MNDAAAPSKVGKGSGKGKKVRGAPACATAAPKKASEPKQKKLKKTTLAVCLDNCKYDLIGRITGSLTFKPVEETEDWNLHWIDTSVSIERVMRMKKYQKINHFPGGWQAAFVPNCQCEQL